MKNALSLVALSIAFSVPAFARISSQDAIAIGAAQIKGQVSYSRCVLSGENSAIFQVSCSDARPYNEDFRLECTGEIVVRAADGKVLLNHPGLYPTSRPDGVVKCNYVPNFDGGNNGYGQ